jgi:predicted DNA-binding protein (MmcQ/YjbR family)
MNVDDIRQFCLSFPQATENLQWGDDLCFKIAKKIFAVVSLESVPPKLCFKCTPEKFAELCELEGIIPAPYVGRYKWVLLERLDVLRDHELEDLIRQSYEMVAAKSKPKSMKRAGRGVRKVKDVLRVKPPEKPKKATRKGR